MNSNLSDKGLRPLSIIIGIVMFLLASPIYAMDSEKTASNNLSNTYINAGVGLSTFGPSAQIGVIYRPEHYSLNFRFALSHSPDDGFIGSSNAEITTIYSRRTSGESFFLEYGTGISAVFLSARPGRYTKGIQLDQGHDGGMEVFYFSGFQPASNEVSFTIGLPVELQLVWNINRRFSAALHSFANLNVIKSNAGVLSTFQVRIIRQ